MWLSNISIERPVLATVMSIIIVILGLVGLSELSIREYPDIDPPVVSVTTLYEGASPEVIETTITEPLEDEITSTEGLKTLTSSSSEGVSTIIATFELTRNINVATQDIRDRVARARQQLPEDVEDPLIVKQDADAQPILWLGLAGDKFSQLQLTDFADRYVIDRLQTISGVGRVVIGGQREYAMRLWLNPNKMAARSITTSDIITTLRSNNIELPSGRLEGPEREFTLRTLGELSTPDEFNQLIIKTVNGTPIRMNDIGTATIGARSERSLVRMNGKTAVGLGVVKQSKANTLEVANGVKSAIKDIEPILPDGMTLQLGYDGSKSIQQSLNEVRNTLFQAIVMVALVIFLFLGNGRATLVPVITIPISLVGVFFVMYTLGYSINTLTLLALVLAIGLVVDDAIVVLETIVRRMEEGDTPFKAAIGGMQEIGFAVIATTLVLVAIFVPLTFAGGTVGRLFSEFAIALSGAVIISTFVALSLAPTMCARLVKPTEGISDDDSHTNNKPGLAYRLTLPFRNGLAWLRDRYSHSLRWAMTRKGTIFSGTAVILVLTALTYVIIPKEFLPTEDNGSILTVFRAPEGSALAYTDKAVRKAEAIYADHPDVNRFFSVIAFSQSGIGNVNEGIMFVTLNDLKNGRSSSQATILQELMPQMMGIEEAQVFPFAPPSSPTGGFGDPLKMVIQGFDLDQLASISGEILTETKGLFGLYNVENNLKLNKPQLRVHVNRERANSLGVTVRDITDTLLILTGGVDVTSFQFNSKRYDVVLQAPTNLRQTPNSLNNYYVRATNSATGDAPAKLVPLTTVIDTEETVAPKELPHYNRLRAATISAGVIPIPGISLGGMMDKVKTIAVDKIAPDMQLNWAGESLELVETQDTTQWAFLLAMVMVFLVLAAQFESWSSPFIIMFTVPLAVCGALLTLYLFGSSFNTYSQIGIILLVGLATKNGILIVEVANALRTEHPNWTTIDIAEAACRVRFRPIMMTAISTIAGALPLILGEGAGAKSRQSLGLAVIGGMLVATLLTLYVLPIIYTLINRDKIDQDKTLTDNQDNVVTVY
jgi:hydrophobe/amphiphile efflux-1 (HAE1) family protein